MTNDHAHVDATQKRHAYAGLSRHYAEHHNGWLAIHAMFAADLAAAHAAALEAGHDTREVDLLVSEMVADADFAEHAPRMVVDRARELIGDALPDDAEPRWLELLANPDWLDALDVASPFEMGEVNAERLGGLQREAFITGSLAEQAMQLARAAREAEAGNIWGVIEAQYAADMAGFSAWLVNRSVQADDYHLVQCEMAWTLAVTALGALGQLPEDVDRARFLVRSRLAWAVHPWERPALAAVLRDPVPAGEG